jgi:putative transposase
MLKSYKYRIYPDEGQLDLLSRHFGHCRWVYNWGLSTKIVSYKETGKSPSKFDLSNLLPGMKKSEETSWLKEVNAQSLQASLENLDMAFNAFFKKKKGFPKFKSKYNSEQSFTIPSRVEVDFDHGRVKLPKFKEPLKVKLSRKFEGQIKRATVSKNASNEYYISILVEDFLELPTKPVLTSKEDILGIDVGLKDFCITSDGEVISNPKFLRSKQNRMKLLQRRLSHKKKGSKNRKKAQLKVARLHQKVVNQRTDFLHKVSTRLIRENQAVAREDLNVQGMMKNHKLARAISDVSWSQFDSILKYKSDWYGKWFLKIGRFDASSKIGNECSHYNSSLTLNQREWTCPECGIVYDRDLNAARNIRDWAFISHQKLDSVPTGSGEVKSVRLRQWRNDIQRKPKGIAPGEVSVGQKEELVRASESPTL